MLNFIADNPVLTFCAIMLLAVVVLWLIDLRFNQDRADGGGNPAVGMPRFPRGGYRSLERGGLPDHNPALDDLAERAHLRSRTQVSWSDPTGGHAWRDGVRKPTRESPGHVVRTKLLDGTGPLFRGGEFHKS